MITSPNQHNYFSYQGTVDMINGDGVEQS